MTQQFGKRPVSMPKTRKDKFPCESIFYPALGIYRMRFSLKTLLLIITIAALLSVAGVKIYHHFNPRHEIALIKALNALEQQELLFYNKEITQSSFQPNDETQLIIQISVKKLSKIESPVEWDSKLRKFIFADPN